jgi:hypothetical protein
LCTGGMILPSCLCQIKQAAYVGDGASVHGRRRCIVSQQTANAT